MFFCNFWIVLIATSLQDVAEQLGYALSNPTGKDIFEDDFGEN